MKVLITSLNLKHGLNPIVDRLFEPLAHEFTKCSVDDCEAIFISFIAPENDFTLDRPLLDRIVNRGVPVVIFDHMETMGRDFFLGVGSIHDEAGYVDLHRAVRSLKTKAYFKRELAVDAKPPTQCPVYPLDWTVPDFRNWGEISGPKDYEKRPIDILMSWGYSSESRPRLYGELMRKAGQFGAHFALSDADLRYALKEKRERIFALMFAHCTRRIDLSNLLEWQQWSKLTVSLKGCGMKCFRCAEGSYNSLLAQQAPETVQWSYPWIAGKNCIGLPNALDGEVDEVAAVERLYEWLRINQGSLHDLYLRCVENQRNYRMEHYSRKYLLPKLMEALR